MNQAYKNILKATTLFGGVQGLNILLNIIRTKFVAVLLGPSGVGLNTIYNEVRELLHSTTNLGLDTSGIKNISQTYERLKDNPGLREQLKEDICLLRSWIAILAVFGMLCTIILAQPLSYLTFQDARHTLDYIMLSPAVALSTLACCELTVLKGIRKLKSLAVLSVLSVLSVLCVSVPIYYFMGIEGILPALIAVYLVNLVTVMVFSWHYFPPRYNFTPMRLLMGMPLLKVGTVFMLVNLIDNLIQLLVQSYLNGTGNLKTVGLFSTNITITATYAGIFFSAMGNDYFPRLSGIFDNQGERISTVQHQSEMLTALMTPAVVAMMFLLPLMIPLLFSNEFIDVIPLTQLALVALMFRTLHLPFTYTPLAAGDSKTFFALNIIQATDVLLVIPGYYYGGLTGIGIMLIATNLIDCVSALVCARWRYNVSISRYMAKVFPVQMSSVIVSYICVKTFTGAGYWGAAVGMILFSVAISWYNIKLKV